MSTSEHLRPRVKHRGPSPVRLGVVETLISQGRMPVLHKVIRYLPVDTQLPPFTRSRTEFHCYVPAPDTRRGDTTEVFYGVRHFQSPSGEVRDEPDIFILRPCQARRVQERINAALAGLKG